VVEKNKLYLSASLREFLLPLRPLRDFPLLRQLADAVNGFLFYFFCSPKEVTRKGDRKSQPKPFLR
jgi:hypothetical protein